MGGVVSNLTSFLPPSTAFSSFTGMFDSACVCVCVCVYEYVSERKRTRERVSERQKERARKDRAGKQERE